MNFKKHFLIIAALLAMGNFLFAQDKIMDFKPSGNVWGYVFGDYYYQTHRDSIGRGGKNVQYQGNGPGSSGGVATNIYNQKNGNNTIDAFQIRRAYLGFDFKMNDRVSVSTVLAHEEGPNDAVAAGSVSPGTKGIDLGSNNTLYLKYLYLKIKDVFKGSDLLIGEMVTPSFAAAYGTEQLWGYRSIERTLLDMHNVDASADMGVSLQGRLWTQGAIDSLKPAFVGYNVMVGDNSSSAMASTTANQERFKKYRATIFVSALQQKLTVGVYADQYTSALLYPTEPGKSQANITLKGYAHYKTNWFRIGAEAFQQINTNQYYVKPLPTSPASAVGYADGIQFGWSVFASSRIIKDKLNVFARMDEYNPNTKFNKNSTYMTSLTSGTSYTATTTPFYTQTFYSFGFDYTPMPRVHFMPNVWINQYNTMLANGTAANELTNGSPNLKSDYDLVWRLSFYFIFNSSKSVAKNGMDN